MRLSVMTYNVHSCIGRRGRNSLSSIAKIIAHHNPDIVALQELDVYMPRTGLKHQAKMIADKLDMYCHFCPSLRVEDGMYGNAVLSRYPMAMKKTAPLPTLKGRYELERRAAMWVEIAIGSFRVQLINTHLGLKRIERLAQTVELLGPEWLGQPSRHTLRRYECNSSVGGIQEVQVGLPRYAGD
jgi:endonuclease/exonuclease/phosphatase family metal-dependent hydrolase